MFSWHEPIRSSSRFVQSTSGATIMKVEFACPYVTNVTGCAG
jgi:hypothetical protein